MRFYGIYFLKYSFILHIWPQEINAKLKSTVPYFYFTKSLENGFHWKLYFKLWKVLCLFSNFWLYSSSFSQNCDRRR
jgi:hypothetical protein